MRRRAGMGFVAGLAGLAGLASLGAGCAGEVTAEDPAGVDVAASRQETCGIASEVQYLSCDEFAGVGLVPLANVIGRVPPGYTVIEAAPGAAMVVAQGGRCAEISVGGGSRRPGIFTQFGVGVVPPTGTGDGNFYQLTFTTDHPCLASQLARRGVNANLDLELDYEISAAPELSVSINLPHALAWRLDGPITLPDPAATPNPVTTFNYWRKTPTHGNLLQQNVVTGIRFGEGNGVVMTATGAEMAAIIGGPSMSFAFFSKPETFDQADVSIQSHVF